MNDPDIQKKLDDIADEYVRRSNDGEQPTIEEYVQLHPEMSDQIKEFLQTLKFVIGLNEDDRKKTDSATDPSTLASSSKLDLKSNSSAAVLPGETRFTSADDNPLNNESEFELGEGEPSSKSGAGSSDSETLGRYKLQKVLGRGGMGIVYLATDSQLDRNVAIKLLSGKLVSIDEWISRFRREARITSALNHPNILTIYEIGEADGAPYIATEFVEGETLADKLVHQEISFDDALRYSIQLTSGIAAAHAEGIIHRDLKPDNLMIRSDGLLKILDFGLARVAETAAPETSQTSTADPSNLFEGPLSKTGMVMGTYEFMSPEQARGQPLNISSDVFSMGIIMFYLFTRRHPFPGATSTDVLAAILGRAPKPFSQCSVKIPNEIGSLLVSCLNKDPDLRPTSREVLTVLQKSKDGMSGIDSTSATSSSAQPASDIEVSTKAESTKSVASQDVLTRAPQNVDDIRYTRSGNVNIAWQSIGSGPIDIVFVMGWVSHLECFWQDPSFAGFLHRLGSFARVILFDKRGTGLSDKVPVDELPTLETRMDDVRAVMEAAGSQRAVLCGVSEGGPLCALFAATYPQKTIAITMIGSYARRLWAEDYPWGPTAKQRELFLEEIQENWGGPLGIEDRAPSMAKDPEFRKWWARYLRMGASPGAAVALTRMNAQIDIRSILPDIQVPTLVIHRSGDRCLVVEEGRYLADKIPGAKFVELPGNDHLPFVGDSGAVLNEIEEFLTGRSHAPEVDRVLATALAIVVEDPAAPTEGESGMSRIEQLRTLFLHEAELFRGRNLQTSGSGLALIFDGPARAVRAARAMTDLADRLNINIRCAADIGACDIGDTTLSGPAIDSARLIASHAALGAVLVSDAVKNLVSGSGLDFVSMPSVTTPENPDSTIVIHQLV